MPRYQAQSRRQFIARSAGAITGATVLPAFALAAGENDSPVSAENNGQNIYGAFPSADPEQTRQVVLFSHANIDGLKLLLEKQPELANASIDWGFGDWECALGAASHMGRRDIAELLIANGARLTHFTFAMLGNLNVVRAYVEANPGIQRVRGPHGITLLAHARNGGDQASAVVEYLESLGDANPTYADESLSDEQRESLLGIYTFGENENDRFEVAVNPRAQLNIKRIPAPFGRALFHQGNFEFHPGGAVNTRIRFAEDGGTISRLTLKMAGQTIEAMRT